MRITLENCEELTLPEPFCGVFENHASLLAIRLDGKVKGNFTDYTAEELDKRLAEPDITQIKVAGRTIDLSVTEGDSLAAYEAVYLDGDIFYLVVGELDEVILGYNNDEDIQSEAHWKRGFWKAILSLAENRTVYGVAPEEDEDPEEEEEPEESEDLDKTKLFILKSEAGAFITIANLLATHYGIMDRPKGGWEVVDGNPYDKIMKEFEDSLEEV